MQPTLERRPEWPAPGRPDRQQAWRSPPGTPWTDPLLTSSGQRWPAWWIAWCYAGSSRASSVWGESRAGAKIAGPNPKRDEHAVRLAGWAVGLTRHGRFDVGTRRFLRLGTKPAITRWYISGAPASATPDLAFAGHRADSNRGPSCCPPPTRALRRLGARRWLTALGAVVPRCVVTGGVGRLRAGLKHHDAGRRRRAHAACRRRGLDRGQQHAGPDEHVHLFIGDHGDFSAPGTYLFKLVP